MKSRFKAFGAWSFYQKTLKLKNRVSDELIDFQVTGPVWMQNDNGLNDVPFINWYVHPDSFSSYRLMTAHFWRATRNQGETMVLMTIAWELLFMNIHFIYIYEISIEICVECYTEYFWLKIFFHQAAIVTKMPEIINFSCCQKSIFWRSFTLIATRNHLYLYKKMGFWDTLMFRLLVLMKVLVNEIA